MGASKIILNNETLIDLTADTAQEADVTQGKTFHKSNGEPAVGTAVRGGGEGGDIPINGVVREYQVNAGATVSAGDFVEFVNKWGSGEFHTGTVSTLSACKLDNNRVLIAYYSDTAKQNIALVLTINGATISVGTPHVFDSSVESDRVSVAALSDSKVIVAYAGLTKLSGERCRVIYARLLTINGATILIPDNNLSRLITDDAGEYIAAVALSDTQAFILYGINSSVTKSVYACVVSLEEEGSSIKKGASTQVAYEETTTSGIFGNFDATYLSEGKVVITYDHRSAQYVRVATIYDGVVSLGDTISVDGSYNGARLAAIKEDVVIAAISTYDSDYIVQVLTVKGANIQAHTSVNIDKDFSQGSLTALTDNKALITDSSGARFITVDGTTLSVGDSTPIMPNVGSILDRTLITFSPDNVLALTGMNGIGTFESLSISGNTITAETEASGTFVQPATSNLYNVGVAKTSGAEGAMVEVYCAK